jgi:hypothetical protein
MAEQPGNIRRIEAELRELSNQIRELQYRNPGESSLSPTAKDAGRVWIEERLVTPAGYTPGTWARLDLSQLIPPNATAVHLFLLISSSTTAVRTLQTRINDLGFTYLVYRESGSGNASAQITCPVVQGALEFNLTGTTLVWDLYIQGFTY